MKRRQVGKRMRTVAYRANKKPGKIPLLRKVQPVCDIWSVGIIGPSIPRRVGHGSGVSDLHEGFQRRRVQDERGRFYIELGDEGDGRVINA